MFAIGTFAVFQVFFAPGMLILQLFRWRGNLIEKLAFTVGLSLIANYVAALLLVTLGLYQRVVVFVCLVLELAFLVYVSRSALLKPFSQAVSEGWNRLAAWVRSRWMAINEENPDQHAIQVIQLGLAALAAVLAVSAVWWTVRLFLYNLGTVFNTWDALLSWNQWAVIWAQGRPPGGTSLYPQLVPINWSLLYVIQGNAALQLFAKAMMTIFVFLILLLMTGYGFDARMPGVFVGVILTQLMLKKFVGEFISAGYVDLPVTFFGFLAVYALLKARRLTDTTQRLKFVQLAMIFAAGAAVTKQAGIYILLVTPLLGYLLLRKPGQPLKESPQWKPAAAALIIALLIALPWYLFKLASIQLGADVSNVTYLTSELYNGAGTATRLVNSARLLEKYAFVLLFLIPAFFVLERDLRWVVLLVILPYTLIWAIFFSYDTRNLALALPFIGVCAGVGLQRFISMGLQVLARLKILAVRVAVLVGLLIAAIVGMNGVVTDSALQQQQTDQQRQILNAPLNEKLYDYIAQYGPSIRILTNYPVAYLPGLENCQVNFWYRDPQEFDYFVNDPSINHLLVPNNANPEILAKIEGGLASGAYQLIFEDSGYIPTRFIRIR